MNCVCRIIHVFQGNTQKNPEMCCKHTILLGAGGFTLPRIFSDLYYWFTRRT